MTMTALRRTSPGQLEKQQVTAPQGAGEDEVLVEMAYASVNPFDAQVLRGEIGDPQRVLTLGAEGAGRIDGKPVQVSGGGLGVARDGTFAPTVLAPRSAIRFLPEGADLARAATVGVAGKTAWRAIHQLADVGPEDAVLVLGASGGVGSFAAQLARSTGARVIAHTGNAAKSDRLTGFDVEPLVADSPEAVVEGVSEHGVTVVLDPLGGDYVTSLLPVLAPSARVVTYGVLSGRTSTINLATLYGKGIQILGTSGGTTRPEDAESALEGALAAVLEGRVAVDHETLDIQDGTRAFDRLAQRDVSGKLLLGFA